MLPTLLLSLLDVVARRRLRAARSQIVEATTAARSKRVEIESTLYSWVLGDSFVVEDIVASSRNGRRRCSFTLLCLFSCNFSLSLWARPGSLPEAPPRDSRPFGFLTHPPTRPSPAPSADFDFGVDSDLTRLLASIQGGTSEADSRLLQEQIMLMEMSALGGTGQGTTGRPSSEVSSSSSAPAPRRVYLHLIYRFLCPLSHLTIHLV